MVKYDYAIFIGRCQPPHVHHIGEIQKGLNLANKVLVVLGSSHVAPNVKNPWSAGQRQQLIRSCFPQDEQTKLEFFAVKDYINDDHAWVTDLHNQVHCFMNSEQSEYYSLLRVCLLGSKKDLSSLYLDVLDSKWERKLSPPPTLSLTSSTIIRELYFSGQNYEDHVLPPVFMQMEASKSTTWYELIVKEKLMLDLPVN